jgi:hypothetical protein
MNRRTLVVLAVVASGAALLFLGPLGSTTDEPEAPAEPAAASEPSTGPATTQLPEPVSTTAPDDLEAPEADPGAVLTLADELVASPNIGILRATSNAMGSSGDAGWVPYLVDMARLFGTPDTIGILAADLAALTGVPPPEDALKVHRVYGSWMYDEEPEPAPGYVDWKARLYGLVDPEFATLIGRVSDPVLASQLQWGGVRRGGIPELNEPDVVAAADAVWMTDEELTFGVVVGEEARAFPHRILDHHELANDVLAGEPVALANCTLCRTGVLFSRRVGDQVLDFETSGLLRNSNKVMVDVQTDSLWNQLTGEAIAGPLTGTVLDRFPITLTTYSDWVAERPETTVLVIPTDGPYSYEPGDAYAEYYASGDVWFPIATAPPVFEDKALVATLDVGGEQLAVGVDELAVAGPQTIRVGDRDVVVVPTDGGARFYEGSGSVEGAVASEEELTLADGTVLPRLQSGHSFWFAWYANFPDTAWWPEVA